VASGFGVSLTRGAAVPHLASAAGYHWLVIDGEHGAFTLHDVVQLCTASLFAGVTPIVRARMQALDEAARALDNGAQGVIVPNVNTAAQAKEIVDQLRYPPTGSRNWGPSGIQFGYQVPAPQEAQAAMDGEVLIAAMIESEEGVANAAGIAAVNGIDLLFVGGIDLSIALGVPSQFGHSRMLQAMETITAAARASGKHVGMGGIYDQELTARFIRMGALFVAGGSDQAFMLGAAKSRSSFIDQCATASRQPGTEVRK